MLAALLAYSYSLMISLQALSDRYNDTEIKCGLFLE